MKGDQDCLKHCEDEIAETVLTKLVEYATAILPDTGDEGDAAEATEQTPEVAEQLANSVTRIMHDAVRPSSRNPLDVDRTEGGSNSVPDGSAARSF